MSRENTASGSHRLPSGQQQLRVVTMFFRVVLILLATGPLTAEAASVVRVVGNAAPPYRIIEGDRFSGIYIDTFREIARIAGFPVTFLEAPQARALAMMQSGEADVMLGPNKTPEREAFMDYTEATFPGERKVFFTRSGRPPINRYEDLGGKTVAVIRGGVYFEPFDTDPHFVRDDASNYESAFRKVAAGRNDAVIVPELQGDYLVRQLGLPLEKGAYVHEGAPSYITISMRSVFPGLRPKIEAALKALKTDGTWEKILGRYR